MSDLEDSNEAFVNPVSDGVRMDGVELGSGIDGDEPIDGGIFEHGTLAVGAEDVRFNAGIGKLTSMSSWVVAALVCQSHLVPMVAPGSAVCGRVAPGCLVAW